MTPEVAQRDAALRLANDRRVAIAALRADLRAGRETVAAVLERREPLLHGYGIIDIVRMAARTRSSRCLSRKQEMMGAAAARERINLIIPLERASNTTIWWTLNYIKNHPGTVGNENGRRASC